MTTNLENIKIFCPSCNKQAQWVPNEVVYNGKRYGRSYMCYWCADCEYMVGCHNNTRKPLGTMEGKELRLLRRKVHAKIDPLWQSGKMSRGYMYEKISKALGFTYHTGESDEETCLKVLELDIENI